MKIFCSILFAILFCNAAYSLDASNNGGWISIGVPSYIHMGSNGAFYLNGTDEGSCGGVKPQYFRIDMGKPHFNELYSWVLYMSAQKKSLSCTVRKGCGESQVWVDYCRGSLK